MHDYDDPEFDALWCAERRNEIADYLQREAVPHGGIEAKPAWHVAPYVSVWAVESRLVPGSVGWWAICGDMPNDYVAADKATNPREAVKAIATVWREAAQAMARGQRHPTFQIGSGEPDAELAEMLASRAGLLLEWVDDDEAWDGGETS